jgi:SulP family sulfate permease
LSDEAAPVPWLKEIAAGSIGALVVLAAVLTLGLLGFWPLGAAAAQVGIPAAFATVAVGGLLFALLGRSAMPTGGPSSATALMLAGLLARLAADPAVSLADPRGLTALVAVASVTVCLMGAVQAALAAIGLGRLVKFVPQPVLAGFMNGVAVLIVLAQVPVLLGLPANAGPGQAPWEAQPATLAIGLATAALTWLVAWRLPRVPAQLVGLAGGVLLYVLLALVRPPLALGPLVGDLPSALPLPDSLLGLLDLEVADLVRRHALAIVTTASLLALVSSLESVLNALTIDQQLNTQHNADRELIAVGMANVATGLFGGLPMVLVRARALATLRAGGRGRRAAAVGALAAALMYLLCGPAIALLPKTVLAGIMLTIAVAFVDQWTRQLIRQVRGGEHSAVVWQSLAIVLLVSGVTVWQGLTAGVVSGVLVSLLVFIRSMNRSLIRDRSTAAARPSRRIYSPEQEEVLREARKRIVVLDLEGALFFGSTERLAAEVNALAANCRFLVLDFRRVTTIDESGAVLLQQLSMRLRRRGVDMLLAGVTAEHRHGTQLRAFGCFRGEPRDDWFANVDRATEAAEQGMLREAGAATGYAALPLESCALFDGLEPAQRAFVRASMTRQSVAKGELLFRQNDAADCLYVLTEGSITIVDAAGPEHARQRFVSFGPGMMLGETAMLDGGGRSASAVADADVVVSVLTQRSLDAIAASRPDVGARLYRNIALHLSQRLRSASIALAASAR